MKASRILLAAMITLALLALGAFLAREQIAGYWIKRNLAAKLSAIVGGDVALEGVDWKNGTVTVRRCKITGSALPFASAEATGLRSALDWNRLSDPAASAYQIEAETLDIVWRPYGDTPSVQGRAGERTPAIDLAVKHFSFRHSDDRGWSIKDAALKARHEDSELSCVAQGGTVSVPEWKPLALDRIAAKHRRGAWLVESFGVRDQDGGKMTGAAARGSTGWAGDFSWEGLEVDNFLPPAAANHFDGKHSGRARLQDGVLTGEVSVSPATARTVPTLVKVAGLFMGEDWNAVPWDKLTFKFTRNPSGDVEFSSLEADSPKGLSVRGSGRISASALAADLDLGVRKQGRPILTALMPLLFRQEKDGYLWAPVHVGGSPSEPTEDLSGRVVEAMAAAPVAAPVDDMIRTIPEVPKAAVEAADSLIKGILGH